MRPEGRGFSENRKTAKRKKFYTIIPSSYTKNIRYCNYLEIFVFLKSTFCDPLSAAFLTGDEA